MSSRKAAFEVASLISFSNSGGIYLSLSLSLSPTATATAGLLGGCESFRSLAAVWLGTVSPWHHCPGSIRLPAVPLWLWRGGLAAALADIFVRILRGMEACRKKPAQPASGTLNWMTPSETLLRLCLGGFGKIFAKQSDFGPIFEKNPSKTCAPQETSPVDAALSYNAASFNLIV